MRFGLGIAIVATIASSPVLAKKGGTSPMPIHGERWVTDEDYPAEALRAQATGSVTFLLSVDAHGVPMRCQILASSGNQTLDKHACLLMFVRGKFVPALDEDAAPVASTFVRSVNWMLPGRERRKSAFASADIILSVARLPDGNEKLVVVRQLIEQDGQISSCVSDEGTAQAFVKAACGQAMAFARPVTDMAGNPLRTLQTWRVAFVTRNLSGEPPRQSGATFVRNDVPQP